MTDARPLFQDPQIFLSIKKQACGDVDQQYLSEPGQDEIIDDLLQHPARISLPGKSHSRLRGNDGAGVALQNLMD